MFNSGCKSTTFFGIMGQQILINRQRLVIFSLFFKYNGKSFSPQRSISAQTFFIFGLCLNCSRRGWFYAIFSGNLKKIGQNHTFRGRFERNLLKSVDFIQNIKALHLWHSLNDIGKHCIERMRIAHRKRGGTEFFRRVKTKSMVGKQCQHPNHRRMGILGQHSTKPPSILGSELTWLVYHLGKIISIHLLTLL